jgi:hypothetical protein
MLVAYVRLDVILRLPLLLQRATVFVCHRVKGGADKTCIAMADAVVISEKALTTSKAFSRKIADGKKNRSPINVQL